MDNEKEEEEGFLADLYDFHLWLVRFRVIGVAITVCSFLLATHAYFFYIDHYKEFNDIGANTGIGFMAMMWVGFCKYGLENVCKRHAGHDPLIGDRNDR